MKKRQEVTEQTKSNLKEAFWSLYTKKVIERITVKEITDLAGYHRGTFYLYYKDTYDVLAQIESELLEVIDALIRQWVSEDALHHLSFHMEHLIQLGETYSSYMGVLLSDQGDPVFASRLKELLRPLITNWMKLDTIDTREADFLNEFYCSGLLSVISKWLCDSEGIGIDQFVSFIAKQLFPLSTKNTQKNSAS